jgi:hypothetical protein
LRPDCSSQLLSPLPRLSPPVVRAMLSGACPSRPLQGWCLARAVCRNRQGRPTRGHVVIRGDIWGCRKRMETSHEASSTGRCWTEDKGPSFLASCHCPLPGTQNQADPRHALSHRSFPRAGLCPWLMPTGFNASAFPPRRLISCSPEPCFALTGSARPSRHPSPSPTLPAGPPCLSHRYPFAIVSRRLRPPRHSGQPSCPDAFPRVRRLSI